MYGDGYVKRKKDLFVESEIVKIPFETRIKGIIKSIEKYDKEVKAFKTLIENAFKDLKNLSGHDRMSISEDNIDFLLTMRNNYFLQKDLTLEISITLAKAIETNFGVSEVKKSDCRVVF